MIQCHWTRSALCSVVLPLTLTFLLNVNYTDNISSMIEVIDIISSINAMNFDEKRIEHDGFYVTASIEFNPSLSAIVHRRLTELAPYVIAVWTPIASSMRLRTKGCPVLKKT